MKNRIRNIAGIALALSLACCGLSMAESNAAVTDAVQPERSHTEHYQLEKMVVFSRHNLRAPTRSSSKLIQQLTPHAWADFNAPTGELTLLGGTQETAMGQFFRQYLVSRGLMPENWIPQGNEVRFYSNAYQRTLSTTHYFLTGLLPVANVEVEYHGAVGEMDPVFKSCMHFISDAYLAEIQAETDALADGAGIEGLFASRAEDVALLSDTLDYADSEYAMERGETSISMEDKVITYAVGEEPKAAGGLKAAYSAADALVMQYYAEPDLQKAAFGHDLSWEQWRAIGRVDSMYMKLIYGLPSVAVNLANPLLKEIRSEMVNEERVFTFFCGHDSNVVPLMVSLGAEGYEVTENICEYTPIGCKLVLEKYRGEDGEDYAVFSFVYQTSEKLRENKPVSLNDPPVWTELSLRGLEKNADGLYRWDDVVSRFDEAIQAYDELPEDEVEEAA